MDCDERLVSVILPSYNSEQYIAGSIESVLAQTHRLWELIIIDDASSDNSVSIAKNYAENDARIKVIALPSNGGVANARNTGIAEATGEWIAFLDSDDVWLPEKLSKQLEALQKSQADFSYCSYGYIDNSGHVLEKVFIAPVSTSYDEMLAKNAVGCSTAIAKRTLLDNNRFSSDFYHEDYLLWIQLLQKGAKFVGVPEVLVHYRFVPGSRSSNKINAAKQRWDIYRRGLNLSIPASLFVFVQYGYHGIRKHVG